MVGSNKVPAWEKIPSPMWRSREELRRTWACW
jgi:hypothetical protein